MIKPRIIVTGATGKTGSVVVTELLKASYPVRALVHQEDGRSAPLKAQGAEIGHIEHVHGWRSQLEGATLVIVDVVANATEHIGSPFKRTADASPAASQVRCGQNERSSARG
jgi:uncharacterized protein YbjT (DUF2867 family)